MRGVAFRYTRLPHFLLLSAHGFSTVRARLARVEFQQELARLAAQGTSLLSWFQKSRKPPNFKKIRPLLSCVLNRKSQKKAAPRLCFWTKITKKRPLPACFFEPKFPKKGLPSPVVLNQNFQISEQNWIFSTLKNDVTNFPNLKKKSFCLSFIWANFQQDQRTFFLRKNSDLQSWFGAKISKLKKKWFFPFF